MNDLLKRLNMENISDLFDETYEKVLNDNEMPFWLSEEYILKAASDCYISEEVLKLSLPALPLIKENPDLVLFSKVLHEMLKIPKHHEEVFVGLKSPEAPEGENPLPYDLFSFFPILERVHYAFLDLKDKGVDGELLKNTYSSVGGFITVSEERTGRVCFPTLYFLWTTSYKNADIFSIGRFIFEIRKNCDLKMTAFINKNKEIKVLMSDGIKVHKSGLMLGSAGATDEEGSFVTEYHQTDEYYEGNLVCDETVLIEKEKTRLNKNEWSILCAPGDNFINIHIGADGSFAPDIVENSLNEGISFLKRLYPDADFKACMCVSWLLSADLKQLLKPTSNIISFQNRYVKFPIVCGGLDIFNFVFQRPISSLSEIDLDSLPEDSSLKKALKELYKSGDFLHEAGGIFTS